jgi:hypothetical protein
MGSHSWDRKGEGEGKGVPPKYRELVSGYKDIVLPTTKTTSKSWIEEAFLEGSALNIFDTSSNTSSTLPSEEIYKRNISF